MNSNAQELGQQFVWLSSKCVKTTILKKKEQVLLLSFVKILGLFLIEYDS